MIIFNWADIPADAVPDESDDEEVEDSDKRISSKWMKI